MIEKNLINAKKNFNYKIASVNIEDKKLLSQLNNFGIKKNSTVKVLGSNYGKKSYLIQIDGINYAIDKSICDKVVLDE